MKRYEGSPDEYDEEFIEDGDASKRPRRFLGIVLVAFGLVATTVAANLSPSTMVELKWDRASTELLLAINGLELVSTRQQPPMEANLESQAWI